MPKSSELFPISKAPTGVGATTDTTAPRIVLLDRPSPTISDGKLTVNIRTLLLDDGASVILGTTPSPPTTPSSKPSVTWVSKSSNDVSTLGEEPMKVQLRIEESAIATPKISWVGKSLSNVSTLGEESMKIQVRIEE